MAPRKLTTVPRHSRMARGRPRLSLSAREMLRATTPTRAHAVRWQLRMVVGQPRRSSSIKRNRARWKTPNYHRRRANAVQYCRGRSSSTLMQSSTAMHSHKFARGKMDNGGHPKRFVRGARGNDNDNARAARTLADERGCALTSLDTRRRQPTRTLANGCREPDASKRKRPRTF